MSEQLKVFGITIDPKVRTTLNLTDGHALEINGRELRLLILGLGTSNCYGGYHVEANALFMKLLNQGELGDKEDGMPKMP